MMDVIVGMLPNIFEYLKPYLQVEWRHGELDIQVDEVATRADDMKIQAENEERQPGKKRKKVLDAYINQTESYKETAQLVLSGCREEQWMLKRMRWVPSIERCHREGQDLLRRGRQLIGEGLTYDVVRTRGEKLPLDEDQYVGVTLQRHLQSAVTAMMVGSHSYIGIYGPAGSGKTNLMKHIHNQVLDDSTNYKAVFWATAPGPDPDVPPSDHKNNYHKALQECVADGMHLDLYDGVFHDEVRSAAKITAGLQEFGPGGRVVIFLDNVQREFSALEVLGIPTSVTPSSTSSAREYDATCTQNCILVFSTRSKEVCNRMRCELPLKMDLLEEKEAEELFLREVGCGGDIMENGRVLSNGEKKIRDTAVQVAKQCARMPLAIIIIARSMAKKDDLREWRNRLSELIGRITTIHDDEAKIIEHLKFGYNSLKDRTVQLCFLKAAKMLGGNCEVSKVDIINKWKIDRVIGMDRPSYLADDQGHAILNQLERLCLLQVLPNRQSLVTMNKWICKMASSVS